MQSTVLKSRRGQASTQHWRGVLPVHPAANMFPRMSDAELRELGEDIICHGLHTPIVIFTDQDGTERLLDGISRLDSMEMVGLPIVKDGELNPDIVPTCNIPGNIDPFAWVLSANLHRRHLTNEQKRDVVAKLLKAKPNKSNLQIAKQVKVDDKTVAKVRTELESTSEIPKLAKTVGKDGKSRPIRQKRASRKVAGSSNDSAPTSEVGAKPSKKPKSNTPPTNSARLATGGLAALWEETTPEQRSIFVDLVGLKAIFAAAPRNLQELFLAQACPAVLRQNGGGHV
jgi:hypothetical protein